MLINDCIVNLDCCVKFHRTLHISGFFHREHFNLSGVCIKYKNMKFQSGRVGLDSPSVAALGPYKGFDISCITETDAFPYDSILVFQCDDGPIEIKFAEILTETQDRQETPLSARFFDWANSPAVTTVLDIGGRSRSQVDRSRSFPTKDVTVLDVLPGENVTVVGDAHEMSALLPANHFDAFVSVSVFEHILMPWKVVLELNHVLKDGAVGLVHTHQTLGMHDMPWDFWRFSDTAWDSIFNPMTGFEITERSLGYPSHILPLVYRDDKVDAEKAIGFEASSVLVRKIGPTRLAWDVSMRDITSSSYPSH